MVKLHFKRTVIFGILGLILGLVAYAFSPPIYETSTALIVGGETKLTGSNYTPDVQQILAQGAAQGAATEVQVLRSKQVFFQALNSLASRMPNGEQLRQDAERLYQMYDVLGQDGSVAIPMASNVAFINVRAFDARTAAELANEVAVVYGEIRKKSMRDAVQDAVTYLEGQVTQAERELKEAQANYARFKEQEKITDPQTKMNREQEHTVALRVGQSQADASIAALQRKIAQQEAELKRMDEQQDVSFTDVKNPIVQGLEGQIAGLKTQRSTLLLKYHEDSREVRELDEVMRKVQAQLDAELQKKPSDRVQKVRSLNSNRELLKGRIAEARTDLAALIASRARGEQTISEQNARMETLPSVEVKLLDYQRLLGISDERYRRVRSMLDDLKNKTEVVARPAVTLGPAAVPEKPVAPDAMKLSFIGLLAGLCVGLIFSFGLESLKLRVHTSSQLAELTGLPVVAAVPMLPRHQQARLTRMLGKPDASPAESFRYMAFFMQAAETDLKRVVMFTGAGRAVGCTSSAAQFAIAMARTGSRVLLVDADLRRASLSKVFEVADKPGLADILSSSALPDGADSDLILPTAHENLSILPAGAKGTSGLGDYPAANVSALIQELRDKAQVIVIDAPPCDAFSDASGLAKHVDEICLVVSARSTVFRTIPLAYEILTRAGAKSVSLVLTQASAQEEPFADNPRYLART